MTPQLPGATPCPGEEQRRRRAADWILTSHLRQVSRAVAQGEREGGRYGKKMVGICRWYILLGACRSTLFKGTEKLTDLNGIHCELQCFGRTHIHLKCGGPWRLLKDFLWIFQPEICVRDGYGG